MNVDNDPALALLALKQAIAPLPAEGGHSAEIGPRVRDLEEGACGGVEEPEGVSLLEDGSVCDLDVSHSSAGSGGLASSDGDALGLYFPDVSEVLHVQSPLPDGNHFLEGVEGGEEVFDMELRLLKLYCTSDVSAAAMEGFVQVLRDSGHYPELNRVKSVKARALKSIPAVNCGYEFFDASCHKSVVVERADSVPARILTDKAKYQLKYICTFVDFHEVLQMHRKKHPDASSVILHADDVPVNKSSGESFDLLSVEFVGCQTIYPLRAIHARRSVSIDVELNVSLLLEDITSNGVKVKSFVADLPKRASVLGLVRHGGFYACHRCEIVGHYSSSRRTVCYPYNADMPLRDDTSLREIMTRPDLEELVSQSRKYREELKGVRSTSALLSLPTFDLVEDTSVDIMHALDLGVLRRLFASTFNIPGEKNITGHSRQDLGEFNEHFPKLKGPSEQTRHPRPFSKHWKASEYRALLIFHLPFLLSLLGSHPMRSSLPIVELWACLGFLVLYLNDVSSSVLPSVYSEVLDAYKRNHIVIFGEEGATMNDHMLLHLKAVKDKFKNMQDVCAYRSEGMYQVFLKSFASGTLNVGKQALQNMYLKELQCHSCHGSLVYRTRETARTQDNLIYTANFCIFQVLEAQTSHLVCQRLICKPFRFIGPNLEIDFSTVGIFESPTSFH